MERDPLRLAWRADPGRNLLAGILLAGAGILLWLGLDLVRMATDAMTPGVPHETSRALFRVVLPMPERSGLPPVILLPGFDLPNSLQRPATAAALLVLPLALALLVGAAHALSASIGAEALQRIRIPAADALSRSPPSTRNEADHVLNLVGSNRLLDAALFGRALVSPLQSGGTIAISLLFTLSADWRLGFVAGLMLVAGSAAHRRTLKKHMFVARAWRRAVTDIEHDFTDLLHRLPAVRAHATAGYEHDRLSRTFATVQAGVIRQEQRLTFTEFLAGALLLSTPLALLVAALWLAPAISPGTPAASALAAFLGAVSTRAFVRQQQLTADAAHFLEETIRSIARLQSRAIRENPVPLPRAGSLAATGLSACDPGNGTRISGIALSVPVPAHIALVGKPEAGARVFAALVGGQLEPSAGRLTLGDVDLAAVDPIERARRIAYAGGETVLIPGSLRDNLAYGCPPGPDLEARLANAVAVAGLETFVHERGLAGTLDPSREAHLAAAIVDARHAVRRALGAKGIDRLVEPFDHGRYNQHATIGENLLFGKPIGDTFREENLASHPFIRAILDSEGLTKKLAAIGHSIAASMVEIFAEIPDGHPLFARFSFFSSGDRAYFADLVARHAERRRSDSARDRERLIGLALRYSESRHRLGLLDESLQRSLLSARASFAKMLPLSLQPSIEIYDASRLCAAASVQDNLLFGRIVFDQAGAEAAVQAIVAEVLSERGLDADVTRIGMDSPVDAVASDLTTSRRAAIDLVRCLVRQPDIVVVERALDGLPAPQANALVARLRRALVGRGLLLVTPRISDAMEQPPFDAVIRFERGSASLERAAPKRELEPA